MEPQGCHYTRFSEVVDDDAQPHREHAQSAAEVIVIEENDDDRYRQSDDRSSGTITHDQHASGPSTGRFSKSPSKKCRAMFESLFNTIARLRGDLRFFRSENRRLQQLLDEQKARKSLECPICLGENEKWVSVQCGHLICDDCVLDFMKREMLFNKPCPLCQALIISLTVCYPNLRLG